MLEHVPSAIGHALQGLRPGIEKLTYAEACFEGVASTVDVTSPAFENGGVMPARFTEDGAKVFPPLRWTGIPGDAKAVVLLIEDADSPTPSPLVHAIAWDLPGIDGGLIEGALKGDGGGGWPHALGKNSFLKAAYLPPDPPSGHGPHRYAFQVYALDEKLEFDGEPGRGAVVDAMRGHVLTKGMLVGTYERP